MARTNKYTSINFNHIHEKNVATNTTTPNSISSKHHSTVSSPNSFITHKTNGRMLVLTRPLSKPATTTQATAATTPPISPSTRIPGTHRQVVQVGDSARSEPEQSQISLRPLGRTGAGPLGSSPVLGFVRDRKVGLVVGSQPEKFVPPHLRPGFAGREERPSPEVFRGQRQHQHQPQQQRQGSFVGQFGESGRPKSGGGCERMRRGRGDAEPGLLDLPRSSGNRPRSSG